MLCFFHSLIDYTTHLQNEGNFVYSTHFPGVETTEAMPVEKIFVTTPSDLKRLTDQCKLQGTKTEVLKCLNPTSIVEHENFPVDVGFKENLEKAYATFKDQKKVTVAVMNAMSNAFGDHLIGCNAFGVFKKKLKETYPDKEFVFNFFQLNPLRHAPITRQWKEEINTVGNMPARLDVFINHDAYIDLGGLILFQKFNDMAMTDFFLHALSVDLNTVTNEEKRLKFDLDPKSKHIMGILDEYIRKRADGRPVMLMHTKSTTPIRSMTDKKAKKLIKDIISKSDYFVISTSDVKMKHDRYMNITKFSQTINDFAAIISNVDAIVTVDTSTVHLADCFSKPTLSYFTCVDPKYRTPYYPFNKSVMLEKEDGVVYGKHKFDPNSEEGKKAEAYVSKLWGEVTASQVIEDLDEVRSR